MRELSKVELLNLLGGYATYNPEACKKLQEEAAEYDVDDPRWDKWITRFYEECVEGEQGDF